jgi:hypothetical protein
MSFLNPSQAEARRRRILVGGASLALTTVIMTAFMLESRSGYSGRVMKVIYMQSWSADRSRADTIADAKATEVARAERLAQSRAYIATLAGPARTKAQEQYDRYVTEGGVQKDIPFVITAPATGTALVQAEEPPVN